MSHPTNNCMGIKTNRTSFLCGNHNGHHNTEHKSYRHIIGQDRKLKGLRQKIEISDTIISITDAHRLGKESDKLDGLLLPLKTGIL